MFNFVLIESDLIYRSMLEKSINSQPNLRCVLSCSSIEEFKTNFPTRARLDFALLDIELSGGGSGLDAIQFLATHFPSTRIMVLTNVNERDVFIQALKKGATDYLLKDFPVSYFPSLIKIAIDGGALLSPKMTRYMIEYFHPQKRIPRS
jgi:DNA-binding NarL/FixJ family response regulator